MRRCRPERDAVIREGNVFAVLMEAVRCCSLGQITHALFEVGGQYRRNMSPVSGKRRRSPDRREEGQGATCLTAVCPASRCDRHLAGRCEGACGQRGGSHLPSRNGRLIRTYRRARGLDASRFPALRFHPALAYS